MGNLIRNKIVYLSVGYLVIFACTFLNNPTATPTSIVTATVTRQLTPTIQKKTSQPALNCLTSFEHREMKEPYQKGKGNSFRFTLSTMELASYYKQMKIQSICIPADLGAPFINVDWNPTTNPSVTGQMISIGFENLYHGEGWGDGYLLYSTYDFKAGTEFDRFASLDDWTQIQAGNIKNGLLLDDGKGFSRFQLGLSEGKTPVFKAYIFPGETSYIALVLKIGVYEDKLEELIEEFKTGKYPLEKEQIINMFDSLALTISRK